MFNFSARTARRWVCADALILLLLVAVGGGLRLYNLLALDPFIDEVTWINEAVEHVYDATDYADNVGVIPRVLVAAKFAGFPGPIVAAARTVDDWQTHSTLWLPTAFHARPPLFFWLTLVTTKLPGNPLIGGRLAALLPDVASGCLLYLLARQAVSRRVAIVAAALWMVSPFALLLARIASDDPLLTLFSIATTYCAFNVMRSLSSVWPVLLGLSLAAAIYTKTLGVLNVIVPMLALLTLWAGRDWPRKAVAVGIGYLVAGVALVPLIPWIPQLYGRANEFADVGSGATNLQLLGSNLARSEQWALDYFKPPFLVVVAVGCAIALARRDRPSVFFLLVLAIPSFALVDRASILFSRYFSFVIYPAYVFAAFGLVETGRYAGQLLAAWRRDWPGTLAGSGLALGGLSVVIGAWLPLSTGILLAPAVAPLTVEDHDQYVEAWYALFGLGTVVGLIDSRAGVAGATVLEPTRPWWNGPRVPEDALQYYFWDHARVRFVESPALLDAENLCSLRSWTNAPEPVFLVIDGAEASAGGVPPEVPEHTRRLEAALSRDLPEAREMLRIPRPSAVSWLSVVQLNARPSGSPTSACQAPG